MRLHNSLGVLFICSSVFLLLGSVFGLRYERMHTGTCLGETNACDAVCVQFVDFSGYTRYLTQEAGSSIGGTEFPMTCWTTDEYTFTTSNPRTVLIAVLCVFSVPVIVSLVWFVHCFTQHTREDAWLRDFLQDAAKIAHGTVMLLASIGLVVVFVQYYATAVESTCTAYSDPSSGCSERPCLSFTHVDNGASNYSAVASISIGPRPTEFPVPCWTWPAQSDSSANINRAVSLISPHTALVYYSVAWCAFVLGSLGFYFRESFMQLAWQSREFQVIP